MKCVKISFLLLPALLIFCQPSVAAQLTLQDTLREMADLLGKQQKQLDEQRKELAEQRELIRELQGTQQTATKEPATSPAEKSPAEPTETAIAQQPDTTTATETSAPKDDQSAQEQAKEALANKGPVFRRRPFPSTSGMDSN